MNFMYHMCIPGIRSVYPVCIPPNKSGYLALAVTRTIPRTGPVPAGLLVGGLPCGGYETWSHPGDSQSEPTWSAGFCGWLMLVFLHAGLIF